jgi:pilus assembly protein Flp/PilA
MKAFAVGIKRFLMEEEGVTMIEYGLIAALISVVVIIALTGVGGNLKTTFTMICNKLAGAVTAGGGAASACA